MQFVILLERMAFHFPFAAHTLNRNYYYYHYFEFYHSDGVGVQSVEMEFIHIMMMGIVFYYAMSIWRQSRVEIVLDSKIKYLDRDGGKEYLLWREPKTLINTQKVDLEKKKHCYFSSCLHIFETPKVIV